MLLGVCGTHDKNLALIKESLGVGVRMTDEGFAVSGQQTAVEAALGVLRILADFSYSGEFVGKEKVMYALDSIANGFEVAPSDYKTVVATLTGGKQIRCKTRGQAIYYKAIMDNSVTFGLGPAGTGKTYLAVAVAVNMFKSKKIDKIILTRPAVEAGEKLGFLPGDLQEKVDPYLRPLYDALEEMFGADNYIKLIERGSIEIAPLAYMRGRTLSNAFIILDEAQNTTQEQMKMFLTRMGEGSKVVINGDLTQIDLAKGQRSGLKHAVGILKDIEDIAIVELGWRDIVRNRLVTEIVRAYEKNENKSVETANPVDDKDETKDED